MWYGPLDPRGASAAAGPTVGQLHPLTPRGRSGGPYHVATWFYFYPVMSKLRQLVPDSRFKKFVILWMWRHHDIAKDALKSHYVYVVGARSFPANPNIEY